MSYESCKKILSEKMSSEKISFIIDKSPEDDSIQSLFPLFSSSKFSLLSNDDDVVDSLQKYCGMSL